MKKLLIIVFLILRVTVFADPLQNLVQRSDTIIKEDSMNFAILMVDFLTYAFEAGSISYYSRCPDNCDINSLPISMYFDSFYDDARVYFYYKYDSSLFFGAWIKWMGTGWIFYPTNFHHHTMFSYGGESVSLPEDAEYYNTTIAGNFCTWEEYVIRAQKAWNAIDSLDITRQFATRPFRVGLYAYPRRVGMFDPVEADWMIFLYRGNDFPIGIQNAENKKSFSIQPNPTKDNFRIEFSENHEGVELEIFDVFGSFICHVHVEPSSCQIMIPSLSWSPGVYIIKIRSGTHVIGVERMVKI